MPHPPVDRPTPDRAAAVMAAWQAELPDVLGPASELSKRVLFLAADLTTATRAVLPEFGLTVAEFDILATLRRSGAPYRMKSNELSRTLMMSTGGTTNVVHRLADAGLVQRESDDADGRATLVRLTEAGATRVEAALHRNTEAHERVFAAASPQAVAAATAALREVTGQAGAIPARQDRP
jgi:DNA-binding MarR family transcriptional regulator